MTYAEIEEIYPEEAQLRKHDKLAYRYPRLPFFKFYLVILISDFLKQLLEEKVI